MFWVDGDEWARFRVCWIHVVVVLQGRAVVWAEVRVLATVYVQTVLHSCSGCSTMEEVRCGDVGEKPVVVT